MISGNRHCTSTRPGRIMKQHLVQDLTQIDLTTNHNPQCHVLATVIGHVLYAQMREPRAMFPQNGGWDDLTQIGYTVITGNTLYWMCKALCSGTSQRPVLGIQSGCHPTYPITLLRGTRANYSHRTSPSINLSTLSQDVPLSLSLLFP